MSNNNPLEPRFAALGALRERAGLLGLDRSAVVEVAGADAADFLQRMCSQDALGLAPGRGARACLLDAKGRLVSFFWLWRVAGERFLCELDPALAARTLAQLERFNLGERVAFADRSKDWGWLGIAGPDAPGLCADAPGPGAVAADGERFVCRSDEWGLPLLRVLGPRARVAERAEALAARGLPRCAEPEAEALRIDAGQPRFGHDADGTCFPLEVGLADACNADKGCYVGQEIVARIRTHGHVNRELRRVSVAAGLEEAALPIPVFDEGVEAGRITSAYVAPQAEGLRGLALLATAALDEGIVLRAETAAGPELGLLA